MIWRILSMIDEGGYSFEDLIRILKISREDLSSMLFRLNRMGYLNVSCPSDYPASSCKGCAKKDSCENGQLGGIKIYQITQKGKEALNDRMM